MTAQEEAKGRLERAALNSLYAEVHRGHEWEAVLPPGQRKWDGVMPLEVREVSSGETFVLEVSAWPTGTA